MHFFFAFLVFTQSVFRPRRRLFSLRRKRSPLRDDESHSSARLQFKRTTQYSKPRAPSKVNVELIATNLTHHNTFSCLKITKLFTMQSSIDQNEKVKDGAVFTNFTCEAILKDHKRRIGRYTDKPLHVVTCVRDCVV